MKRGATLREISDLVGLRLDQFPECRLSLAPSARAGTSLREMVAVLMEPVACSLTRELPLAHFSTLSDMRQHIRVNTDWGEEGYAEVDLPEDFCRLHSLRLEGWGATLSEDYAADPLRVALGEMAPGWLASQRLRPWLRIMHRDSGATLRFGPPTAATPLEANYVALPRYDADDEVLLNLDPALILPLSERIAELLKYDF